MARKKSSKSPETDAGPGHNSGEVPIELTEDQRCALLIQGVQKIEVAQGKMETLKADIRNLRKQLKVSGFDTFEVNYALRLRKADDTEELDRRRREARIAKWFNHPVGMQADMFDEVDRTPSVDKAFADGKLAGMSGEPCSVPSHHGQEQSAKWIEGWQEGQAALAVEGFAPLSDAVEEESEAA